MRYYLILIVCLIISVNVKGQKAVADSLVKVSFYKISTKNYYAAMKNLNKAIAIDPSNAKAYKARAMAKNAIKEYRSALEDAHKSINYAKYFDAETFLLLGRIYVNLKEYDSAIGYINNALNINPQYFEAINEKALIFLYMSDYEQALIFIEEAIAKKTDYADFYFTRGLVFIYQEKYQRAINSFDKALSLKNASNKFAIYLNRGVCNLNLLNYEKSIKDFNEAISLDPYNASAYHSRGRTYYELQAYDAALNDFNKSLQISPESGVTYYNLGMVYFRMHDKENACVNFHKGCSLGSKSSCKMVILNCASGNQ